MGKLVTGGLKMLRHVNRLVSRIRLDGYIPKAQQVLNASYAEEAARETLMFAAKEGGPDVAKGAVFLGASKLSRDFGDAYNHGRGTLKESYGLRQQLELRYQTLTKTINVLREYR